MTEPKFSQKDTQGNLSKVEFKNILDETPISKQERRVLFPLVMEIFLIPRTIVLYLQVHLHGPLSFMGDTMLLRRLRT